MKKQALNQREQAVFDFICKVCEEQGYSPSVRDICTALHYRSTSTVQMYLDRLECYGYIRREGGKSRSVYPAIRSRICHIPILDGTDALNAPEMAERNTAFLDFCVSSEIAAQAPLYAIRKGDREFLIVVGVEYVSDTLPSVEDFEKQDGQPVRWRVLATVKYY